MAQDSALVDLIAKQEPNTTAIDENVVVTVDVTFARDPQHPDGTLRLSLTIPQAKQLAGQIQPALVMAGVNAQKRR